MDVPSVILQQPWHAQSLHRLKRIIDALAESHPAKGDQDCRPGEALDDVERTELEFLACYMRIKDPRRRELLFNLCQVMASEGETLP